MKRTALIITACLMALSLGLFGCAKTISGTPAEVLKQCDSVPAGEKPTVEITGYVKYVLNGDALLIKGRDDDTKVMCQFTKGGDLSSISEGDKVTVTGTYTSFTDGNEDLWITECSVKK